MTTLYRRWERMAEHVDCALLIVHHSSKGNQSDKRPVDVGSGASAQARSADGHIALREHEQENCVVFDCRVRSFPPPDPMVLRWTYPLWQRDLGLDPTALKTGGRKSRNTGSTEPTPEKPEPWTVDRFVSTFITSEPKTKGRRSGGGRYSGFGGPQGVPIHRRRGAGRQDFPVEFWTQIEGKVRHNRAAFDSNNR
jgi:hypothetical protein